MKQIAAAHLRRGMVYNDVEDALDLREEYLVVEILREKDGYFNLRDMQFINGKIVEGTEEPIAYRPAKLLYVRGTYNPETQEVEEL